MSEMLSKKATKSAFNQTTTDRRHLDAILKVSLAIGKLSNESELMSQVISQTTLAFNADRSTLFLHDEKNKQLYAKIAQGLTHYTKELRIADTQGLSGHVFQTLESVLVHDTFDCQWFDEKTALSTIYLPRSMMAAAIVNTQGHAIGVLQTMSSKVSFFTQDDLRLLEAISVQVAISLENASLHNAQRQQFQSFVHALSTAIDARDPCTQEHSINVANYAQGIGYKLGLEFKTLEWLRVAGLLHDVGKIGTPEAILLKPGKLEDDEYTIMKEHASHSRRILSMIDFTDDYKDLDIISSAHHERLDGRGYPDGLVGEQLPLKARILAVADVFDALTQDRHYRKGMPTPKAFSIIDKLTPDQLDQPCVHALKKFMRGSVANEPVRLVS